MARPKIDLVTFEVLRHRLWEINDEMGLLAGRVSGSPAVYESGDFNTAILTPEGKGLFAGVYVIRQASALDVVVQNVLKDFDDDIHDGDIFLTTDPWAGALHAMDAAVVAPVFWDDEIVAWTGIVMHELDVGGPRPGSWSVGARDAYQECPLLPPVKIVDRGSLRRDVEAAFLRNSRTPEINGLNLRAKIASQITTRERLHDIIREFGKEVFLGVQEQVLEYVRDIVRKRLALVPDGTWYANCILDHDGTENAIYRLKLTLTKTGDRLTFDFTGTSPQAPGPINCAWSGLVGGILQVLFPLLCFDTPWSHGAVSDCIDIVSEEGTLNNATFPAATSMATVNACQATGDLVWEAMARMYGCADELREEVIALGYGGVNMAVWAGKRSDGRPFVNLFTDSVGGGGARSFRDGVDTSGNFIAPAYAIPNVERIESLIPVLYVYRKQCAGTAGAGKWRGGVGLEFMIVPHGTEADIESVYFSSGCTVPETKGVFGGLPGSVQRNIVLRDAGVRDRFSDGHIPLSLDEAGFASLELPEAKDVGVIRSGDAWLNFCTGGGGYGDPLGRAVEDVQRDLDWGLSIPDEVTRLYGIVLDDGGHIDIAATDARRNHLRKRRLGEGRHLNQEWTAPTHLGAERHRIGELLCVRESDRGEVIACRDCATTVCAADEDPRHGAVLIERPITNYSTFNQFAAAMEGTVREYACPGCGTLFSADVALNRDDPIGDEMRLALGARGA